MSDYERKVCEKCGSNTTGASNNAYGVGALYSNTTGYYNSAYGVGALYLNTTGVGNNAYGNDALGFNTTGNKNNAYGVAALYFNTTGVSNTAIGYSALLFNTTGNYNNAYGNYAPYSNTTGGGNSAYGVNTLLSNTTGGGNSAYGTSALLGNTTGNYNIAIGYVAGSAITTGSNNVDIASNGVAGDSGTIRIGSSAYNRTQSQTFIAGITGVNVQSGSAVYVNSSGQLGTLLSSRRFKTDIHDVGSRSQKLLTLRPVTFRYKQADETGSHPLEYGLIAEEVAKVFPELVQYDKEGKPLTVYYHQLTPLLLAEVQKEDQKLVAQQVELVSVKKRDVQQQSEIASLKQQIVAQQQQQSSQMAFLQQKLNQLDHLIQASNTNIRLSKK